MKKNALIILVFPVMLGVGLYVKYHSDIYRPAILPVSEKISVGTSANSDSATTSDPKLPQHTKDSEVIVPKESSSTPETASAKYRSCNNPEEKLHYGSARVSMEIIMENVGGDLMVTDPDGYSVPNWHQTSEEILNEVPRELYMGIPFDVDSKWRPMWDVYSPKIKTGVYTIKISQWKDVPYDTNDQLSIKFLTLNGCILVIDNEHLSGVDQKGRTYYVSVPDDISGVGLQAVGKPLNGN